MDGTYVAYSKTGEFTSNMIQITVGGEQGVFADIISITEPTTGNFKVKALTRPAAYNEVNGKRDD